MRLLNLEELKGIITFRRKFNKPCEKLVISALDFREMVHSNELVYDRYSLESCVKAFEKELDVKLAFEDGTLYLDGKHERLLPRGSYVFV